MSSNTEYNGWTNYETWRVNLEFGFADNPELFKEYSKEDLQEYVEETLTEDVSLNTANEEYKTSITLSYALAFTDAVNWYEITRHLKENC